MNPSNQGLSEHNYLANLKYDFASGIVVFLVALPLCLGIALASGADLFTGLISGIVGGIVIGSISGSQLAVSGPAAGLAVIVMDSIHSLGDYKLFLAAVVLAGVIQLGLGFAKAGFIANFFPSSVIKGMLAAIGVILILKQIPHALGDDLDYFGNMDFLQWDRQNTFSEIILAIKKINPSALIISAFSLFVLLIWPKTPMGKIKALPAPLIVVIGGILINQLLRNSVPGYGLTEEHLVSIPISGSFSQFLNNFNMPAWSGFFSYEVILVAFTIAIVASIETLLSIEAIDKIDPMKRITPTNKELKAQGIGNIVAGLIGGLPLTAVIVRGSANVAAGAKTKVSAIVHGFLLLICVILIPKYLNLIPLASLAAILLLVGYKLTNYKLMKDFINKGQEHAIPFFTTIVAIVFTDLLKGIAIGLVVALYYILKRNYSDSFSLVKESKEGKKVFRFVFASEVSFLNKSAVLEALKKIPEHSEVWFDATKSFYIDDDVVEIIQDFKTLAEYKFISIHTIGLKKDYDIHGQHKKDKVVEKV